MPFDFSRVIASQVEGKALGYHPALVDRVPTTTYGAGRPRQKSLISQRNAALHADAYGGKQAIDWVYDAINLFSDPVSTAPYRLERLDGTPLVPLRTKGTPPDHEIGPPDLYRLLQRPNPYMLYSELMSLLVIDLLLVGNAYWLHWRPLADGRPLALYRLSPAYMKIIPGEFGPDRYEYQPPGATEPLKLNPKNVTHFRRPNPHSSYYGMGVIQGGGRAMDLELAITDTQASYFENRADPSLIVQSERRVPRDVFNKLRAQLRSRLSGSSKAGEMLLLEAGLKATPLSPNARDALFDALSKMSRDRIFVKFRTSPLLYGLAGEASGSNKISDARREFDAATLRPFMFKLSEQITAAIASLWDCIFIIDHEHILPPEEAIKVGESIAKLPGVKVREIRRAYRQFGLEESTGDVEIDEMVLNLPGEDMDEDGEPVEGDDAFADRPLGTEAGRPPKGENTRAFPAGTQARSPEKKALDALADLERVIERKAVTTPAPDNRLPGERRPDDTFARARQIDIDAAQQYMITELRAAVTELERGLLDAVEGKALKTSDIVARVKQSKAWTAFRERIEAILSEGVRRAAVSGVMHANVTPDDDIDYDAIVKSIVHRPDGLRSILKNLKARVAKQVKETRDSDGERRDFETAIRTTLESWAGENVVAIADSEATEAYNEGTITVAEMAGVESFLVIEEDDAPDKPCQDANGQVWDVATARARRKEHPRCRRAFIPLAGGVVA